MCAVLNSTLVALLKFLYGRQVGREGNLDTEVIDTRLMLIPDVRAITPTDSEALQGVFESMRSSTSLPLVEEFEREDRRVLDDVVLKLIGIGDHSEREKLRSALYSQITALYREIREVELKKQAERRITARRDRASPRTIAEEIWEEFDKTQIRAFPTDFVTASEPTATVTLPAGKPKVLDDLFDNGAVQINGSVIKLGSRVRADFAAKTVELGQ